MLVAVNGHWQSPFNLDNHTWFNIAAYTAIFIMIWFFDRSQNKQPLKEEDRQEARRTIEQTAYLEFLLVHQDNDRLQADAVSDPRFRPPLGYTNLIETTTREGRTMPSFIVVSRS